MSVKQERRSFIGLAFGAVAAVGGAMSLVAVKKTWDPLPSVKAAGFTTVDLSPIKDGEMRQVEWRKKPIFILKKSPDMAKNDKRDVVVGDARYVVLIGLCTHLGCIKQANKCLYVPVMAANLMPTECKHTDLLQDHLIYHHLRLMEPS